MKQFVAVAILMILATCVPTPPVAVAPTGVATPAIVYEQKAPLLWSQLLQKEPYPFSTPLPLQNNTPIDGFYAKVESKEGTPVPCKRCPDYLPEGGVWKLHLDQGAYRVFHEYTGWRSLGSFALDGDHLTLFNDPTCPHTTGHYTWQMHDNALTLDIIEDDCQVNRRARTFANIPWPACQPKDTEAAISDHWPKSPGCENLK